MSNDLTDARPGVFPPPHADCSGMSESFDHWVAMTEALSNEMRMPRDGEPCAAGELRRLSGLLIAMNDDQRALLRRGT